MAKAQEEVDKVLQGRRPAYEDIKDLKFLTRCIIESLRLYPHPPVGFFVPPYNNFQYECHEMQNILYYVFGMTGLSLCFCYVCYEDKLAW